MSTPCACASPGVEPACEIHGVPAIPRKGSRRYMAYLESLPLPPGLAFWCLAPVEEPPPGVPRKFAENIWCVDEQGSFVRLTVDLRQDLHQGQEPIAT